MHICCAFAVVVWHTFWGTTTAILGFFLIQEILKITTSTGPLVLPSLLKKQPYFGDPITVLYYFSPTFCFHVHRRDPAAEPVFTRLGYTQNTTQHNTPEKKIMLMFFFLLAMLLGDSKAALVRHRVTSQIGYWASIFQCQVLTVYNRDIDADMHILCAVDVVFWRTFRGTTTAILGFFSIQEILKISTGTGPLVLPSLLKKKTYCGTPSRCYTIFRRLFVLMCICFTFGCANDDICYHMFQDQH